jgi:Flp pilus assembly protein TadG
MPERAIEYFAMVHSARRRPAAGFGRLLRRFVRRQDGATMVEFSIVVMPFLALLFAIIETALIFFAGQVLETAAADSARLIMTGQAQNLGYDQGKFKEAVCAKVFGLFDCTNGVSIDVKTYPSFAAIDMTDPIDATGKFNTANFGYQPGTQGSIVVVRLFYQWPVFVSLLSVNLADIDGGKRLLAAAAVFRNEPF